MKSALNGGLNLSIRDGWWDEWYDGENGWEIPVGRRRRRRGPSRRPGGRRALRPAAELGRAEVLRARRARASRAGGSRWSATPCRRSARRCWRRGWCATTPRATTCRRRSRCAGPWRPTATGRRRSAPPASWPPTGGAAFEAWPQHRRSPTSTAPGCPTRRCSGSKLTLTATVQLAGLRPDEVTVQAVVGRVDASDALVGPGHRRDAVHRHRGRRRSDIFSTTTPLPVAGPVGYTVRVLPHHPMLAAPTTSSVWSRWLSS